MKTGHFSVLSRCYDSMLNCEEIGNSFVYYALRYVPKKVLDNLTGNLVIYSSTGRYGLRIAKAIREKKEIILLSEQIFPREGADWETRFFTFVVLHEIAHVVNEDKSPKLDNLSNEDDEKQEKKAEEQAIMWFNEYIKRESLMHEELNLEEVEESKQKIRNRESRISKFLCQKS